ncbi:MAG: transcription antitermination factor NusB [Clostridia bacterium]|nr:transcription antitermination factor NusB [Clostridia bacterium]
MKQMSRREARIKAYELIFMMDMCDSMDFELDRLEAELAAHKKHMKYIRAVVDAAVENKTEIDKMIEESLGAGWSLSRLSKMSLAALRLAVSEIKYLDEIPEGVSINEAVEIAKLYCEDNEPAFINGVLGVIVK